jgi:hypothetical protein
VKSDCFRDYSKLKSGSPRRIRFKSSSIHNTVEMSCHSDKQYFLIRLLVSLNQFSKTNVQTWYKPTVRQGGPCIWDRIKEMLSLTMKVLQGVCHWWMNRSGRGLIQVNLFQAGNESNQIHSCPNLLLLHIFFDDRLHPFFR